MKVWGNNRVRVKSLNPLREVLAFGKSSATHKSMWKMPLRPTLHLKTDVRQLRNFPKDRTTK